MTYPKYFEPIPVLTAERLEKLVEAAQKWYQIHPSEELADALSPYYEIEE